MEFTSHEFTRIGLNTTAIVVITVVRDYKQRSAGQ